MNQTEGFDHKLLEIYGELSRDRLMELVVGYARDRLGADGSSIFLRDSITGRYVLRSTTGLQESTEMPDERIEYGPGEGLTGWIAKHGRPLCIANVQDRKALRRIAKDLVWSKKYTEISPEPDKAYLGVPILSRDEKTVLGVLRVSGQECFEANAEALLKQVAALVSIAIENSQRYEQEKRRARYFELLLDISSELDPRRPIDDMLQAVAGRVRKGFRTEACQIYLRTDEDIHRVALRAASGLPQELVGKLVYTAGEGLTGHVIEDRDAIQIREPAALEGWRDPYAAQVASHLPSGMYRSFVSVPLQLGEEILGTLELINKIPSSPGHRDWFTDADEDYLRLLSTAIGGVLEGARYLETLNDVGITAMRMQQVASLGTLAQRILHETANPLAAARLATANLRATLGSATTSSSHEAAIERLDKIEGSLDLVSDKLFNLLTFSQRIGFVRTASDWNDVVRGVLIWLVAERQWRGVEVHTTYAEDLPPVSIEPNETFGIVATMLRLAIEAFEKPGGLIEVSTSLSADGQSVHTEIHAPKPPLRETIISVLEPTANTPEELSPIRFEWALAQETVETRYAGNLTWQDRDDDLYFVLEIPVEEKGQNVQGA
ncbi:MAG: GAF domain-containing protein [Anaerolineae bacterium]|nr:GAF domain-containing protein [Anaerolineae bacterium]